MPRTAMPRRCAAGSIRCRIGLHALEIGAGNGALLERLRALGFAELVGIEPSREAAACGARRSACRSIRIECFDPG